LSRNHSMEVLDSSNCTIAIENGKPVIYYCNEIVDDLDAIIPRIGASNTSFGVSLIRHFQSIGVFSCVKASSILQSRNKWTSFQILIKKGVPVPKTFLMTNYRVKEVLDHFTLPVIIKILEGTHGNGVILAETYPSALSTMEALRTAKVKFIVQEYISESKGADLRVIVIDGQVVAAMKRQSQSNDFRSNLHRGGSSKNSTLTPKEHKVALQAAKALKLGVCGVDILQSNRGPLVLEVNSTPGLEGIEKTTGVNVSEKIITYIERNKK